MIVRLGLLCLLLFGSSLIYSQKDSTDMIFVMDSVVVSAPRLSSPVNILPRSISIINVDINGPESQGLSLNEFIDEVPGLFALNANNYAQDLRVSIRGFGARSAFGIRGVKLLVDGIPETTPDGQGQIDNLDLAIITRLEILRGSSSSLYGNASGGVISLNTLNTVTKPFIEMGATVGSFNMLQYEFSGGIKSDKSQIIFHSGHLNSNGYRDYASMTNTNLNARWLYDISTRSSLDVIANYTNSPEADDPGGINIDDVAEDRRAARDRNVLYEAGESIEQLKLSMRFKSSFDKWALDSYTFINNRSFFGFLPFEAGGVIDLDRLYYGLGASMTHQTFTDNGINRFLIGFDWAHQNDERQRFDNLEGDIGPLSFYQDEIFANLGVFAQNQYSVENWTIDAGLRFDFNQLKAVDQVLTNGDNSDSRTLNSLNPSIGLSYSPTGRVSYFINLSTSFETPTLSELSADPSGTEGFNQGLSPQSAFTKELGLRGSLGDLTDYELVLFHVNTNNEIVSYEVEAFPGRDFFRNAGKTVRKGIELSGKHHISPIWTADVTYAYMDIDYKEFINGGSDFSGNRLPGIPAHRATISSYYHSESGLKIKLQGFFTGDVQLNDANTAVSPSYQLVNLYLAQKIQIGKASVTPFFGINNLLDEEYFDNVRINAFGGRYYEPGPKRYFYGGFRMRI